MRHALPILIHVLVAMTFVVLPFGVAGCRSEPIVVGPITPLEGPSTALKRGASTAMAVAVKSPSGMALEFKWSSQKGSFSAETTKVNSNLYRAPEDPGADADLITVVVSGGGQTVSQSLQVKIAGGPVVIAGITPTTRPVAFDFERDTMGWRGDVVDGSRGVVKNGISHIADADVARQPGRGSLKVQIDIDPTSDEKAGRRTAEFGVNLTHQGDTTTNPVDLTNRTITYYVKLPTGFPINRTAPHLLQPFAQDDQHKNYYGCYRNIEREDELNTWIQVDFFLGDPKALPCVSDKSKFSYDAGFSTRTITVIGMKIGTNPGNRPYNGPVYLDDVKAGQ